jgi:hypothetical protein
MSALKNNAPSRYVLTVRDLERVKPRYSIQIDPPPPDTPPDVHRMHTARLDLAKFQQIWARSEPLVVSGIQRVMRGRFTPAYFVQRYGKDVVTLIDCESDSEYPSTVAEFFSSFGVERSDHRVFKLKVAPTSSAIARH